MILKTKTEQEQTIVTLGLGGNLPSQFGAPVFGLVKSLALISRLGRLKSVSRLYTSKAYPVSDQPDFLNCVLQLQVDMDAENLLQKLHDIEHSLARERSVRWGARTIDIDLLLYGDAVLPDLQVWHAIRAQGGAATLEGEPLVPHVRLDQRAFVLKPLLDVLAPDWQHPVTGVRLEDAVKEMDAVMAGHASDTQPVADSSREASLWAEARASYGF